MQKETELSAIFINTSLKADAGDSHTQLLLDASAALMEKNQVRTEQIHLASRCVPPGVQSDLREQGHERDDWPEIWERIQEASILIVGTPIWLGEESSLCRILIERLYAVSGELNEKGQSKPYGKVGGCVVTGNEDGLKHVAMSVLYALNHVGFTIAPQADCGWIGEAGPGPSFGDLTEAGHGRGFDNEFTQQNTTIMSWNAMHLARMLSAAGGIPREGNDREQWSGGERFGFELPERKLEQS